MPAEPVIYLLPQDLVERWKGSVKKQTLAKWRTLRRGPPYTKIGGRVLYELSAVEAFEEACRTLPR